MGYGRGISRRQALMVGAGAAVLPLVHVRTAGAAGTLKVAFWDHWVPAGNDALRKQVDAWAKQNKVEVMVDFITSNGNKNRLTYAAEAQAKTGHDIQQFLTWDVLNYASSLEPMDDVMQQLSSKYGGVNKVCEYLAKQKGHWLAIPTSTGTQNKPPCARISWFKKNGLDLQAMYPVKPEHTSLQDGWTYDEFLKYAELAHKDGLPFGLGLGGGLNTDAIDMVGAMFHAFGADLVDEAGNVNLKSDGVQAVLEYSQKLVKFLPPDAASWDDASNNRALISGKSMLICNPPSAWAVAKRDAPQIAADCWTFSMPAGPKGRFVPYLPYFWGIWNFSQNKQAAKELITYLLERPQVEERCRTVSGYDIPPFDSMLDFNVWAEVEPPKGTVYNYPIQKWHMAQPSITGSEASPDVAVQMYNRAVHTGMLARLQQGQSVKQVVAWAQDEIEGYLH